MGVLQEFFVAVYPDAPKEQIQWYIKEYPQTGDLITLNNRSYVVESREWLHNEPALRGYGQSPVLLLNLR